MTKPDLCKRCGSGEWWKAGLCHRTGQQRWKCKTCGSRHQAHAATEDEMTFSDQLPPAKRYVVTAAQNATPVHQPFLDALKMYCQATGAALIVVPYRYKNPTSHWTKEQDSQEWWAPEVVPYLVETRDNIAPGVVILGDIKVQPTAVSPLTGLDGFTGGQSGILAHPKLELKTVATPQHALPKIMTTTGAVTLPNYTDTKAGKKGAFHHHMAACLVEIDGDQAHIRQICAAEDGSFIDLDMEYNSQGSVPAPAAAALIMGDTHCDHADPDVIRATFGAGGIVERLSPGQLVWHDLLDFYSRNHHHKNDPFLAISKRVNNEDVVLDEVARACAFIDDHTPADAVSVVVPSNHNDALTRWINESDWKADPVNAETYLKTALAMAQAAISGKGIHPFKWWAQQLLKRQDTILLDRDDSHVVHGVELGLHGDKGANGARGTIAGLSKLGVRTVIGHSHSPGIREGTYQVGTSSKLKLEYNSGPSSWMQTHCVIYGNGQRSLITIQKGKWYA